MTITREKAEAAAAINEKIVSLYDEVELCNKALKEINERSLHEVRLLGEACYKASVSLSSAIAEAAIKAQKAQHELEISALSELAAKQ